MSFITSSRENADFFLSLALNATFSDFFLREEEEEEEEEAAAGTTGAIWKIKEDVLLERLEVIK